MSNLSGKVQTVLGLLDPEQLGRTMTHEHLTMSFECCYFPPAPGDEAVAEDPFHMRHMHWLRQNPYSSHENLLLQQETAAVRDELLAYRKAGGGAIVENTTTGIERDLPALRQLAKDTGVHIIAGAGYYVDCTHSQDTRKMSVEKVWPSLRIVHFDLSQYETESEDRKSGTRPVFLFRSFSLRVLCLFSRTS